MLGSITLVAANTAAMSIRERRGEIAILRSLGFQSRTILGLLIGECAMLGAAGGLFGVGAGWLVLRTINLGESFGPASVIMMPSRVVIEELAIAIAVGIASGIVPTLLVVRRNIVDQLRAVA